MQEDIKISKPWQYLCGIIVSKRVFPKIWDETLSPNVGEKTIPSNTPTIQVDQ